MKKLYFLLALGSCALLSSCTTSRTYHVTETTYLDTGPVVKESVVVVERVPSRIYVEEYDRDFIIVERRPFCGPRMMFSHRFHHFHPGCYRYYPRSHSEFQLGFGFGFHN
jgi:hypothetical protein